MRYASQTRFIIPYVRKDLLQRLSYGNPEYGRGAVANPMIFAAQDPEHFAVTMEILSGGLTRKAQTESDYQDEMARRRAGFGTLRPQRIPGHHGGSLPGDGQAVADRTSSHTRMGRFTWAAF